MKKLISLVLVLALALSIVSFASADEKVTINLTRCLFNLATPDEDQVKKVEAAINEYIADKINVEVKLTEISSGEYQEKVNKALANPGEINLLWTASWEAVIGTNDLVPLKAVYDITDLLPGTALYESMAEGQWAASSYTQNPTPLTRSQPGIGHVAQSWPVRQREKLLGSSWERDMRRDSLSFFSGMFPHLELLWASCQPT